MMTFNNTFLVAGYPTSFPLLNCLMYLSDFKTFFFNVKNMENKIFWN